jgi:two-component system alkaline phosphatase synthesis response regulator PhoP
VKGKVLFVEDDEVMSIALRDGLESEGYFVQVANDGEAGLRLATELEFDLIILDVMLPKLSGIDLCKQYRQQGKTTPIIMLTARGQELDKVIGLRSGADDYVTKPFSLLELLARIEAVLRRASRQIEKVDDYRFGDILLDFKKHEATKGGAPIDLSPREFKILKYLIEHRGEVITRDQLLDNVWSYDSFPLTRTVDTHIAKLRHKIENTPNNPRYLITVHGVGYKFIG